MKPGLLFITLLFCFQSAIAETKASFIDHLKQLYETDGIEKVIKESELQHNLVSTIYKFDLGQLNQLGYELLGKNKANDAIQLFRLNIKYYPDSWGIKDSLAEGYLKAGKLQQSLEQYQYTFSLLGLTEHDNWDRKWTIGQLEKVYTKMEKPDAILPLYKQEVEVNPYADWAIQRMGEVLLERGQQVQGIDYLNRATRLQASPDKAWKKLGEFRKKQSNKMHTTHLEQNWTDFPYLASSWDQLAFHLLEQNKADQAKSIIEEGLSLFMPNSFWRTAKHQQGQELIQRYRQDTGNEYFTAMGCGPYRKEDQSALKQYLKIENASLTSSFIIHLGDIVGYHGDVPESSFSNMADILTQNKQIPAFIVLGDNEWNDSRNPEQSLGYWNKHLRNLHLQFQPSFAVKSQPEREENFSFVDNNTLFMGINLPAGKVHDKEEWGNRLKDNATWIQQNLAESKAGAAVIMAQASPEVFDSYLLKTLNKSAQKFDRPILFIHADWHRWFYKKDEWASNIIHVVVDKIHSTAPHYPPIQVGITNRSDMPFVFDRRIGAPDWQIEVDHQ